MSLMIELRNVSCFIDDRYILKDITWKLRSGENWALIGLNGAGKTTLLNLINGYVFQSSGTMKVMGKSFGSYDWRDMRRHIGFVSTFLQEKFYPSETTEEIVLSGLYSTIGLYKTPSGNDMRKAVKMLQGLQCGGTAGRRYAELSQGEKQRVLIARALISSPRLLILDEPCAGLDIVARERVLTSIASIGSGRSRPAIIYVAHHTEEITPSFTRTLLLKGGRVHSLGRTKDMFSENNLSSFLDVPVDVNWQGGRAWVQLRKQPWPVRIGRPGEGSK